MTTMADDWKTALRVAVEEKAYAANGANVTVLRDIGFAAGERELLVITGPSGCGKTTLLNLVAGLDADYRGQIDLPAHEDGALPLSFVFQESRLLPWRTVGQNLDLASPPGARAATTRDLLEQMGVEDALHRYPSEISLGMSKRVALARAFSVDAPLLLMDEPFASIDERMAERLRELLLARLDASPRTVLFVTHNLREALFLGHRLLVLSSHPARLLDDIRLPGNPGRASDEIEALRADLLARFPDILG